MAQLAKCLPCKHENLSLIPPKLTEKVGCCGYTTNLSAREAETEYPWGLLTSQLSQIGKLQVQ